MNESLTLIERIWIFAQSAFGPAVGSFCAFLLGLLTERSKRSRERWEEHCNNLDLLQIHLIEVSNIITTNRALVTQIFNTVAKNSHDHPLIWSKPHPLPRGRFFVILSPRQNLVNDLLSLNENVRKLNSDTECACRAYGAMRSAFLAGALDATNYHRSIDEFRTDVARLVAGYNMVEPRVDDLLAKTRVSFRKDQKSLRKRVFWGRPKTKPLSQQELEAERRLMQEESDEVRSRSKAEIERFLGGSTTAH